MRSSNPVFNVGMSTIEKTRDPSEPNSGPVVEKKFERRLSWEWNYWLLGWSFAILVLLASLSVVSYSVNSQRTAETFLSRASLAASEGRLDQQAIWLNRYLLMFPADLDVVVDSALAADHWCELAEPSKRESAIKRARKFLGNSLARLEAVGHEQINEIRWRYIRRLYESGGEWNAVTEEQLLKLKSPENDPMTTTWLAMVLARRTFLGGEERRIENLDKSLQVDPWHQLSHTKSGEVLLKAIELNPEEVDLYGSLVELGLGYPESFNVRPEFSASHRKDVESRIGAVLARDGFLSSSQARLIKYRFLQGSDSASAASIILDQLDDTVDRLQQSASEGMPATAETDDIPSSRPWAKKNPYYWDYWLVLESTKNLIGSQPYEKLAGYFELLVDEQLSWFDAEVREDAFYTYGRLAFNEPDPKIERAIEIWQAGLDQVNPYSLKLLGPLSEAQIALLGDSVDEVEAERVQAVLNRLNDGIETVTATLASTSLDEISRAQRMEISRKIDVSKWRLGAMRAYLNSKSGQVEDAIAIYDELLSSQAEVSSAERVMAAKVLAAIYQKVGCLDMMAEALDRAVELDPSDFELRAQAANAWSLVGNRMRANEHWQLVGVSDSIPLQVSSLEAKFNYQLRLPPRQRDFSSIRNLGNELTKSLKASVELPGDQLRGLQARLAVLNLSIPPSGTLVEKHLNSEAVANEAFAVANRFPDRIEIQIYAAERAASAGQSDRAWTLIQAAKKSELPSERLVGAEARILAIEGKPKAAYDLLVDFASESQMSDPNVRRDALLMAARFASDYADIEDVYDAMFRIPATDRKLSDLFRLAQISAMLPPNSSPIKDGDFESPAALSQLWIEKLKELDGDDSEFVAFLNANRLLQELGNGTVIAELDDARLVKVKSIVRDLLNRRPRWGEAISLEGWVAAIEGQHKMAVQYLRRGLSAGDSRFQTRKLLWNQLAILNRFEEIEEDIELAELSSLGSFGELGMAQIGLAVSRKNLSQSVQLARETVDSNPDDYLSYTILARTLIFASQKADLQRRTKMLTEAKLAIEKAVEIAQTPSLPLVSTQVALILATGDDEGTRKLLDEINPDSSKKSIHYTPLRKIDRYRLASNGYAALGDIAAAIRMLESVDNLQPSAQNQVSISEHYRNLNMPNREIEALRLALSRAPKDPALKNRLALAIATRDGPDVNWVELTRLLDPDNSTVSVNRFMYALILSSHGDANQQQKSVTLLRKIVSERNARSLDATRLLVSILRKQLPEITDAETRKKSVVEITSLFQELLSQPSVETGDLYRFADFLLRNGGENRDSEIEKLIERLNANSRGSLASLEIGVRFASLRDKKDSIPDIVKDWVNSAAETNILTDGQISSIAGNSLVRLGFDEYGLSWLRASYSKDPTALAGLVVALCKVGNIDESLTICYQHHLDNKDVTSLTLLAETMAIPGANKWIKEEHVQLVESAITEFEDNPGLLESVATWCMEAEDFERAAYYYQRVIKLNPNRIRAFNNLAMAYTELPGRESLAIKPIEAAIRKTDWDHPELLDTYGVVMLRINKPTEAEAIFRKAISIRVEDRYQIHLVQALLANNKRNEAQIIWDGLISQELSLAGLTRRERSQIDNLKQELGAGVSQ